MKQGILMHGHLYDCLLLKNANANANGGIGISNPGFWGMGHGFRKDLFQMVADLKPKFLRFPASRGPWCISRRGFQCWFQCCYFFPLEFTCRHLCDCLLFLKREVKHMPMPMPGSC